MLLPVAACEALGLLAIFFLPRNGERRAGLVCSQTLRCPAAVPGAGVSARALVPLASMFLPSVCRARQGQGTKRASLGPGLAKLEGVEPHSARGLHLSAPGAGGKAAEGLGSLNPVQQVDFSDHVSSICHTEVRWLES